MIPIATLQAGKWILAFLAVLLQGLKFNAIRKYNKNGDEPIFYKLLTPYSSMEVDGSYSSIRRKTLQYCNRKMGQFYVIIIILVFWLAIPYISKQLGLD